MTQTDQTPVEKVQNTVDYLHNAVADVAESLLTNDHRDELTIIDDALTIEDAQPGETPLPDIDKQPQTVEAAPPVVLKEFADARAQRAYIFQKKDIKEEIVEVPEWDMKIKVKGMTGKQRAATMQGALRADGQPDFEKMYALLVIHTARHPVTDEFIFQNSDRDSLMGEKSGGVIERLAMKASALSGLDQAQQQALAKN